MGQAIIRFLVAMAWFAIAATPGQAINWEGHEDFFMEKMPIPEFTEGIAKPIAKPLPSCDARAKRARENPYEQEPIAGKNCVQP
jgi:hypothetical protein